MKRYPLLITFTGLTLVTLLGCNRASTPTYVVSFKNYDGSLLSESKVKKGETAVYQGQTPTRASSTEYDYIFIGWDQSLENIISNCSRVAQYNETVKPVTKYYTVTFKNWDGALLDEVVVQEGNEAVYGGLTPTRPSTPEFTYAFTGWDQSLKNITSDCTRVAQFSATNVEYSVRFYSYDNQLLYTDVVHYQQQATFYGTTPTKPSTSTHTYVFREWDKDFSSVTKSIDVYPLFDEFGVKSEVTIKTNNGETDQDIEVTYDEAYDLGTPSNPGYIFAGWYINDETLIPSSGTWTYLGVNFVNARWEVGKFNFALNSDNESYTVSLTEEGKAAKELFIPSSYEDLPVTTLEANFAKENTSIEKVIIPGSILNIPDYAFYKCTSLKEATLNDGLQTIGAYAFHTCNKLTKLIVPSTCTSIGNFAFDCCSELYHVYIPSSVVTMGTYAFDEISASSYLCVGHNSIPSTWASNWTEKTIYTMSTKLVESSDYNYVVRSNYGDLSVTILRLSEASSQLQNFVFPNELEGITDIRVGFKLFYQNLYLRNVSFNSVTRIGNYSFTYCSNLQTVTFSNSLVSIGKNAFRYCSSLTRVEIPDSVTEILEFGFDTCANIEYVYVPSTVVTIGQYAFDDCGKAVIYTNAHAAGSGWSSTWNGSSPACPTYYDFVSTGDSVDFNYVVQSYLGDDYVTITGLKDSAKLKKNIVIPDEIEGIGDIRLITNLFYGLSELVSIDVGDGVSKIPESCFQYCTKLETVTLHEGVTSIGKNSFNHCSALKSINMPSTLTTIAFGAFDYCAALREVVIPLAVTTIGSYAFDDSGIMALLVEASVAKSGWASNWYGSNTNNKQFVYDYVSSGVIGEFRYAKSSNGVTDTVHILGVKEGSNATNLVVPDQIEGISNIRIANYAFYGNTNLKTIDLGNSVTYVGSYSFGVCSSLASVIIPLSCSTVKNYAFSNCPSSCVIHCEAASKPEGWESSWNSSSCQLDWGYVR